MYICIDGIYVVVVVVVTVITQTHMASGTSQVTSVCEAARNKSEGVVGYVEN